MGKNNFKPYLLTGGLSLALPLVTFAKSQSDSLRLAKDSIDIASLRYQVSQDGVLIQDLTNRVNFGYLICLILFILIVILSILTILLVRGKVKRQGHRSNQSIRAEFENLKEDFRNDSERKNRELESVRAKMTLIEKEVSELKRKNDFEEVQGKKSNQSNAQQQKPGKQTQYLKANNEGDFFFEGSNNSDGCQFKITFTSKVNESNGNLTVIANIENLKGIPAVFLKKAVHVLNNVSLKEARSFTVVHEGICEYQQEGDFGTWMIKKPIDIQLRK